MNVYAVYYSSDDYKLIGPHQVNAYTNIYKIEDLFPKHFATSECLSNRFFLKEFVGDHQDLPNN